MSPAYASCMSPACHTYTLLVGVYAAPQPPCCRALGLRQSRRSAAIIAATHGSHTCTSTTHRCHVAAVARGSAGRLVLAVIVEVGRAHDELARGRVEALSV